MGNTTNSEAENDAELTEVAGNPYYDWDDDRLKRRFATEYAELHLHGITEGLNAHARLTAMETELMSRGFDPSEVIGPKVISAE